MSNTIDQRVVEMQFDNKNFEQNVSTSMSTLDKFKEKLQFKGATKGLEDVESSAKKVDVSPLGRAVESVSTKFSAMQVVAVTALANITNSAVNAGKRMLSALTIDPVKTGFNEYELKMDSIKTIMASTGESVETVNKYLNELNKYSDETIYSFADMTQNIGKFTNAGVKLEDAVMAIKGISNEAAISGANANEASRAMYNFAQALSSGYVKLIDWKSIENANMATVEFKQQLIDTGVALGTVTEAGDGMYKTLSGKTFNATQNFNDVLQEQWMTSEVLVETLKDYADESTEIGKKGKAAAQDVTKLTQVFDILKETAQSGWAQTWELIIGNIEEAKAFLTPMTEFFQGIIDKMSEWRNGILESALGRGFKGLVDKINSAFGPIAKTLDTITTALDDLDTIANKVIRGDYRNSDTGRFEKLTEEGYNYCRVQNRVNELLGDSFRYTQEQIDAQDKLVKTQDKTTESIEEEADAVVELTEERKAELKRLVRLEEEELRQLGYNNEQIQAIKELCKWAEKLGIPIDDFIDKLDEINGRWLLLNSFKNIGKALVDVFNVIKKAWQEIFPPKSIEERGEGLFNLIGRFHKFTASLRLVDAETGELTRTGENLVRTFKGIFAVLDVIRTLIGGAFRIAFKVIQGVLSAFNLNITDVTAAIGDLLVKFRDWFKRTTSLNGVISWLTNIIKKAIGVVKGWYATLKENGVIDKITGAFKNLGKSVKNAFSKFKESEAVTKFMETLRSIGSRIGAWFGTLKDSENIGRDIILGLINGITKGLPEILAALGNLAMALITTVKDRLQIHSPSKVFWLIGGYIVAGLVGGVVGSSDSFLGAIKGIFQPVFDFLGNINWGSIAALGSLAALIAIIVQIINVFRKVNAVVDAISGFGDTLVNLGKSVKKMARAKSFQWIAIGIAILAASLVALSLVDQKKLWSAVGAMAVMVAVVVGLMAAMKVLGSDDALEMSKCTLAVLEIAAAILIVAIAMKILSKIDKDAIWQSVLALAAIIVSFALVGKITGKMGKGGDFGNTLLKMAAGILILAIVAKMLAKMTWEDMGKAAVGLAGLTAVILGLVWMTKFAGKDIDKVGKTILKIALAIAILTIVAKMIAKMSWADMGKAVIGLAGLSALVLGLIWMTKLAGKDIDKVGKALLQIGAAFFVLALTAKIIAGMEWAEMGKAAVGIAALGGIIVGLIAATRLAGSNNIKRIGKTILQIAIAIGILGLVCALLGMLPEENLKKGLVAVTALGAIVSGLIAATKLAGKSAKNNIIAITICIAVMAAAVAALSFIKPEKLKPAVEAMAVLMAVLALVLKAGSNVQSAWGSILTMTAIIAVMTGAIWLLSKIDSKNAVPNAIAMGILMSVMVGVLFILSKISMGTSEAVKGILMLTAMIVPMFAFVAVLAVMNSVKNAEANARVLITLMTAMTILLVVLTIVGAFVYAGFIGVAALLAMAVPMLAFIGILALMNKIQNAQENADLLIGLMTKLTKILVVLALIGPMALIGVTALTALVTLMGVVAILAAVIGALTDDGSTLIKGIDMMVIIAEGLGRMIGKFITALASEVMTILPALGTALSDFMTNAQVFIEGCKNVNGDVLAGVGILAAAIIALTVADLLAAISSFLQGGSSFAQLGTDLSAFMTNADTFIKGAAAVTPAVMEGVKTLASAILVLTAANLLDGIARFFGGDSSLTKFANELPILGEGIASLTKSIADMTPEDLLKIQLAARAIKILAEAADEIPNSGGWVGKIVGDNDLGVFADQFPKLGSGLVSLYNSLDGFDEKKLEIVTLAANAIKILAEAAGEIPNSGGWVGKICGDNDLDDFAEQFPALAEGINGLLEALPKNFDDSKVDVVSRAAECVKKLSEAAKEIPNEGGWIAKLIGDNRLKDFGDQFPYLGAGIAGLLTNLGTLDDGQVATIECAANAVKVISDAAALIPKDRPDWVGALFGDNDMVTFAQKFPEVGKGLRGFCNEIGTFTDEQRWSVTTAMKALTTIVDLANVDDIGDKIKDIKKFSKVLPDLGSNVNDFVTNMPSGEAVTAAVNALANVMATTEIAGDPGANIGTDFALGIVRGINSQSELLTTAGTDMAKNITDGIQQYVDGEGNTATEKGNLIADNVLSGVKERIDDNSALKAGESLGSEVVKGVRNATSVGSFNKYSPAEAAGREFANGLVRGMTSPDRLSAVYNAGYKLGKKAEEGYDDATGTASPSKVMIEKGKWYGEGLIVGINRMGSAVYGAGHSLGETATKSISNTISSIADAFNSDVDTQPTIRPVLDLSDVRTGASALGSMLDMNSTVGVRTNVRAISSMMNGRSQNGANDDVVSAINKLRKDLGNTAGATYQINGVTYDDGSNIREAVETIVRAARIERRV